MSNGLRCELSRLKAAFDAGAPVPWPATSGRIDAADAEARRTAFETRRPTERTVFPAVSRLKAPTVGASSISLNA